MLLDTSTNSTQRRLVSSSYCLTYRRSCRAQTFQSTCRRSSPWAYSRCCANSIDCPKYGLRCMPLRKPSTMNLARSSRRAMRFTASGCKNGFESGIAGKFVFLGGRGGEEAFDHGVGGDPFAFGGEVHHQAMAEHGL